MMITLSLILEIFLFIYLSIALAVFINFIIRPYNMTITNSLTNEKIEAQGLKKLKWFFFFSLIWPVVFYINKED